MAHLCTFKCNVQQFSFDGMRLSTDRPERGGKIFPVILKGEKVHFERGGLTPPGSYDQEDLKPS